MIGCLGWGSLVWDPRELPVHGAWFQDGPFLPLEFARTSSDGRLTLVLVNEYEVRVRSLWTIFSTDSIEAAQESLRLREGVWKKNAAKHIAVWQRGESEEGIPRGLSSWASQRDLDAVVWTTLPPKCGESAQLPTADQAVAYIKRLVHEKRRQAERYVRMAPRQIDTPYRRRFEAEFGWTPLGPAETPPATN